MKFETLTKRKINSEGYPIIGRKGLFVCTDDRQPPRFSDVKDILIQVGITYEDAEGCYSLPDTADFEQVSSILIDNGWIRRKG